MNLHAMRDLNRADPLGELGPRVERKPEPPPAAPEPVGIITDADGKMRTNLPLPGNTDVTVWPFPSKPAQPIDDGGDGLPACVPYVPGRELPDYAPPGFSWAWVGVETA